MRPHAYIDLGERDTLPGIIARRAAEEPDRAYLTDITGGSSLKFGEAHDRFLTWADALRRLGVEPGDRVGVMLPNSFDAVSAWLGTAWLLGYEVALNTAFRGEILKYFLNYTGISLAVVTERLLDRFAEVAAGAPQLRTIVVPDADVLPRRIGGATMLSRRDFLGAARPATDLAAPQPHDVMSIAYTSGTTGASKGVVLPWGMLTLGVALLDDLGPEDALYSPFPMFHMSGKGGIAQAAYMNGRDVFRESFDTGSFWKDIDEHRCTFTLLVPQMAHWLLAQPPSSGDRSHALRSVLCTPVVPGLAERFGVRVRTHYGMTEVGNVMSRREVKDSSPSCGRPVPGYEVRLVDDRDYEVATGEVGELVVRSSAPWQLCLGYWRLPEKTAEAWRNGWFHTGDAFIKNADGNYLFVDRKKDALRRRGENISSFEIEQLVGRHPAIAECAAIGVDTAPGEQEIKIYVVPRPGTDLTHRALIDFLIETMPRYMVPRFVEFVSSLPKTEATFRVQKVKLRERPLNNNTWDRLAAGVVVPK